MLCTHLPQISRFCIFVKGIFTKYFLIKLMQSSITIIYIIHSYIGYFSYTSTVYIHDKYFFKVYNNIYRQMSVGLNKNNTFSVFAYNQRSCSFLERPQRMTPSLRHDVVSGGIFVWVFLFGFFCLMPNLGVAFA